MALKLLQKTYSFPGRSVAIRDSQGSPAQIYASPQGGLVSNTGNAVLDSSGVLNVYLDESKEYTVTVYGDTGSAIQTDFGLEAGRGAQGVNDVLTPAQTSAGAVGLLGLDALNNPVLPNGKPGPVLRFKASGTNATPLSTFIGANAFGALGKPQDIRIPANYLVQGQSMIRVVLRLRKSGTDAASYLQLHLGPTNGSSDPNLLSGMGATQFSSLNPYDAFWYFDLSISNGSILVSAIRAASNVGLGNVTGEFTGSFNPAVDNYLNFVISGATTGNSYLLLAYSVDVLQ